MFKNGVPEWVIPSMFVALFASFFLAFNHPWGALIAAVSLGGVVAFGYTRRGRDVIGGVLLVTVAVIFIGAFAWLGSLI